MTAQIKPSGVFRRFSVQIHTGGRQVQATVQGKSVGLNRGLSFFALLMFYFFFVYYFFFPWPIILITYTLDLDRCSINISVSLNIMLSISQGAMIDRELSRPCSSCSASRQYQYSLIYSNEVIQVFEYYGNYRTSVSFIYSQL